MIVRRSAPPGAPAGVADAAENRFVLGVWVEHEVVLANHLLGPVATCCRVGCIDAHEVEVPVQIHEVGFARAVKNRSQQITLVRQLLLGRLVLLFTQLALNPGVKYGRDTGRDAVKRVAISVGVAAVFVGDVQKTDDFVMEQDRCGQVVVDDWVAARNGRRFVGVE